MKSPATIRRYVSSIATFHQAGSVANPCATTTTAPCSGLRLLEPVDEIHQVEEAPSGTGADDARGGPDAEMRFAGAVATDGEALRLASREAPVASSPTWPSSTGVSAKTSLSRFLRTGNLEPLRR